MPRKLRFVRMDKDSVAWERNDKATDEWHEKLKGREFYVSIANLITKHKPGKAVEVHRGIHGSYNIIYRLEYADGTSACLRAPRPYVRFPEEKFRYEAALMRYVSENTTIPVPKVYYWGPVEEDPYDLRQMLVMDFIDKGQYLGAHLIDRKQEEDCRLDPDIDEDTLESVYGQMANVLLQLSTLTFPRIGSLVQDAAGGYSVSGRPLTQNMNDLVEYTAVPNKLLPSTSKTYTTANEWYSDLADMHMIQLVLQQNNAADDEEDARDKYVARVLFRRLASTGELTADFDDEGISTFRIYSEDLNPSNALIDDDLNLTGVVDWEFAYVAPAQFSFDPPWWLIMERPERWRTGYDDFMEHYKPRFDTFIRALQKEEKKMAGAAAPSERSGSMRVPLSQKMQDSWEKRTWMINLAAHNSYAFDFLYWRYLDAKFFGPNEQGDHHARLHLLTDKQREAMESLVELKMEQKKEAAIVPCDDDEAAALVAKFMV